MSKSHYVDDEILKMIKPEKLDELADQIENYMNHMDKFVFVEGITDKEYQKIEKAVKKAVKRLRKRRDLHKVFNIEKFEECCREDPSFAHEYLIYD